jgi:hypothetical protein
MQVPNHPPNMRDDYEIVTPALDPRRIELSASAAILLHNYIAQEYIPEMLTVYPPHKKKIVLAYDETSDLLVFGKSFGLNPYQKGGLDSDESTYTFLKLAHHDNDWKLRLQTARYKHDGSPHRVATRYFIDVTGSTVLQAQLETRVYTSKTDDAIREGVGITNNGKVAVWRRLYERPMDIRDVIRIQHRLIETARRCVELAS